MTIDATNDIEEITRYTLERWGEDVAKEYVGGLVKSFYAIGEGSAITLQYSELYPDAFVLRYRKHFVFYLAGTVEVPLIFGIFHHKRDILSLLKSRLM